MLSKKMAFSLMSLITILALAFVVPSAMAATFGADLIMTEDVSHQDGLQLGMPGDNGNLEIEVKYAKAIRLDTATNVFITIYDLDGNLEVYTSDCGNSSSTCQGVDTVGVDSRSYDCSDSGI